MRCLPPTAGRVSGKPKIFSIPKLWYYQKNSAYPLRSNFTATLWLFYGRLALDRLTHWKDECSSVTKAPEPVRSEFAVISPVISLRPYLAQDRLTHCKDECSSAMKSAKSRRFGPPQKNIYCERLALSENFGLRRLVLEDCVHHHAVPANRRGFRVGVNPRNFGRLARRVAVCEPNSTVLTRWRG